MSAPLTATEAKELLRLCESGRLYEIDAWIRAGRSLTVPHEIRKTPLAVAISTGFHSLVELLLRNEQSQQAKNEALQLAIQLDRAALVELAVVCGADTKSVPFLDVLMTGDRALAAFFLGRGADPLTDYHYGSHYQTPGYKVPKGREAIRLLIERGARWTPEPSSLNDTRRILYRLEPDVTVELLGLLLTRENGEAAAHELLRVPRMRQHVATCERQLSRLGLTLDGRRRRDVATAARVAVKGRRTRTRP